MQTQTQEALQKRPPTAAQRFGRTVEMMATREIEQMLGSEEGRQVAAQIAMSFRGLLRTNPKVAECTPQSVAFCVVASVLTGLMPSPVYTEVDVIPRQMSFKDASGNWQERMELTWQVGFRGCMTLARRAGYRLSAYPVYQGQEFDLDPVTGLLTVESRFSAPPVKSWDRLLGVVVTAHEIETGRLVADVNVGRDKIEARRACSDAWLRAEKDLNAREDWKRKKAEDTPWVKWPEEMAMKTAIKYVIARGYVPVDTRAKYALDLDARGDTPVEEPEEVEFIGGSADLADEIGGADERPALPEPVDEAEPLPVIDRIFALEDRLASEFDGSLPKMRGPKLGSKSPEEASDKQREGYLGWLERQAEKLLGE